MRWEFFDRNPITMVRQSAKRDRTPDVLTADELKALLAELAGVYRVMVFVAATTGLRVSELLGLRWSDRDFESGEIRLRRGIVRQHETEMKTEASRKPGSRYRWNKDLLKFSQLGVQSVHTTSQTTTSLLQSRCTASNRFGRTAQWRITSVLQRSEPGLRKRIGWHTLRHTFGTLLKANGEDVATVQALMRHANVTVTMNTYVQAVTPAKRKAQRGIIKQIREVDPDGPTAKSEMPASA